MSQPDPCLYQCVNCFDAFNIHNPNSHPRILRCQHNMCTRCLIIFISDFTKLTSSNSHLSSTGSKLSCTLCRKFSPIDNGGIDRFPINNQILNQLEKIQVLNELEQEAISKAKTLEKWDNRLNQDSLGLNSLISDGLTEMKQHYEYLSKRLTEEYNFSVHTFAQKHTRIRRKFQTDINLIQKQKDDITHLLRNRDTSNSNTNQFHKSIFDTESLINKLTQHSNLSELDNLNSIVNNFTSKSISTQHTAPNVNVLPTIHTAQGTYTPRDHSISNELSRSVDRTYSQTHLPVDVHSLYDCRPLSPVNRISTVPDNSYRQAVSPVPWSHPPTPPKQPMLLPTRSCLSPTRAPLPSNNPTFPNLSPVHNPSFISPTYSPARSFIRPANSSYRQLSPSHKPTLITPTHHPMY